ncbi:MAG: DoxX family protein [Saprospiraceae bacterium]|jgi:thiosulfate dehydrogenase [quinone] large subunit|nr:DoxX family protein [Saprospiraceae bacterium]MBK9565070.1 DoxX family protein [Saprospiraceae bacterium]MBP6446119.1 DoxX family protein [Saprospiraceae bacterium]
MKQYTSVQLNLLVIVRVLIGWHFLYEGVVKYINKSWTAAGFLNNAEGWFAPMFKTIGENASLLGLIDNLNISFQIIVGLCLILGLFTKINSWIGILLLSMYYLALPPFPGLSTLPGTGSYLIVDRNLIEIFTLALMIVFPTSHVIGLDRFVSKFKRQKEKVS